MKSFLLLLLLSAPAQAAVNYWIDYVEYNHDESSGTFTLNGATYGRITGGSYVIKSSDTVTGQKSEFRTSVSVSPYLTSFPSASVMVSSIQADANNKAAKTYLDLVRAQSKLPLQQPKFTPSTVGSPGISTTTVTLN